MRKFLKLIISLILLSFFIGNIVYAGVRLYEAKEYRIEITGIPSDVEKIEIGVIENNKEDREFIKIKEISPSEIKKDSLKIIISTEEIKNLLSKYNIDEYSYDNYAIRFIGENDEEIIDVKKTSGSLPSPMDSIVEDVIQVSTYDYASGEIISSNEKNIYSVRGIIFIVFIIVAFCFGIWTFIKLLIGKK